MHHVIPLREDGSVSHSIATGFLFCILHVMSYDGPHQLEVIVGDYG